MKYPETLNTSDVSVIDGLVSYVQAHSEPDRSAELIRYEVELQIWLSNLCHCVEQASTRFTADNHPSFEATVVTVADDRPVIRPTPSSNRPAKTKKKRKQEADASFLLRPWAMV